MCHNSFMSWDVLSKVNTKITPTLVPLTIFTLGFESILCLNFTLVYSTLPLVSQTHNIRNCYVLAHTPTLHAIVQHLPCSLLAHFLPPRAHRDLFVFNWQSANYLQPRSFQHYITYVLASTDVATLVGHVIGEAARWHVFYCCSRFTERGGGTVVAN